MFARPVNAKKPLTAFTHTQPTPATVWTITHGLGRYPAAVRLTDEMSATVVGDVIDLDINTVQVTFTTPVQGKAFVS
jgi:hypothetical protein